MRWCGWRSILSTHALPRLPDVFFFFFINDYRRPPPSAPSCRYDGQRIPHPFRGGTQKKKTPYCCQHLMTPVRIISSPAWVYATCGRSPRRVKLSRWKKNSDGGHWHQRPLICTRPNPESFYLEKNNNNKYSVKPPRRTPSAVAFLVFWQSHLSPSVTSFKKKDRSSFLFLQTLKASYDTYDHVVNFH